MKKLIFTITFLLLTQILFASSYTGKLLKDHHGEIEIVDFTINLEEKEITMNGDHGLKLCPILSSEIRNSNLIVNFNCFCNSTGAKRDLTLTGEKLEDNKLVGRINKRHGSDMKFLGFFIVTGN